MKTQIINGVEYEIIDTREKITIADSFVVPANKTGDGNGEAKLYVGQEDRELRNFFGEKGFLINCFILKKDLIDYLEITKPEYFDPQQDYRKKDEMPLLWQKRSNSLDKLHDIIEINIREQIQISGPRVYVNSDDYGYQLIRELSLPKITFLDITKLQTPVSLGYIYHFLLYAETERDIEPEIENNDVIISSPFDPNKIKVRTVPSTIGQIVNDLEDHIINLDTEFQRLPGLWDRGKQSRFIESLLLRLPIPAFYFNEKEENDLEVVDGLQRISTIKNFVIDKTLQLEDLEFLKNYNDCTFDTLPPLFSRRIKTFPITTYVIEKGTPDEVKYNIFKRVNTGGLVLEPQEIRHAINNGTASELVADLVRGEDILDEDEELRIRKNHDGTIIKLSATEAGIAFVRATDNKIGSNRMEDRDFATRFVSFYLIPYQEYQPDLDTFLNSGMAAIKMLSLSQIIFLKENFKKSMDLAYNIFKNDAFRKRFSVDDGRKPINKALFEVLSVSFAKLSDIEREKLAMNKEKFKEKFIDLHNEESGDFLRSITQGTAQKDNVIQRFEDMGRIITETIKYD